MTIPRNDSTHILDHVIARWRVQHTSRAHVLVLKKANEYNLKCREHVRATGEIERLLPRSPASRRRRLHATSTLPKAGWRERVGYAVL